MNKLILIATVVVFLFTCGNETAAQQTTPAQGAEEKKTEAPAAPAVSEDIARQLRAAGFVLPAEKVKAPDFTLKDFDGNSKSLSSFQGKFVFLNFWGVWCFYCRQEMPSIQKMYDQLKDKGLEIVAVNVQDSEKTARDFIKENNHTFPVLLDTEYTATQIYGIRGFPTTFLVDREGYLVAKLVGSRDYAAPEVISVLTKLLAE
ncbi:MAG: TlpA family protein disulfide reductase [Spirochaetales bacterium]|nr:TlpA family protein disulfide reductase [Spirochaetales bacterium]